ncbi:MAG TPA: DUF6146 family protein [Balneolales bacterium]|nr:DUF6146 family protein [Balneolales bacterium]
MRKFGLILILSLLVTACAGSSQTAKKENNENGKKSAAIKKEDQNGKQKYKLIVLDPSFETWYEMNWSPATEKNESYYHYWNERYVTAWNYKASHAEYSSFFDNTINYDFNTNYGIKVERKLYYYFRYVETQLHVPILDYQRLNTIN